MKYRDRDGLTEQEFLRAYRPGDYPRPSVTVDMVLFTVTDREEDNYRKLPEKELRVLLIRRGGHPFLGAWALPGGFVRPTESVGEAACRELAEESGVKSVYLEQLYTFSRPGRDPRTWVISCAHMALVDSARLRLQAGDDADEAAWFRIRYQPVTEHSEDPAHRQFRLELCHGEETLRALVEHSPSGLGEAALLENEGLAFDHAAIIAQAIQRLRGKLEYTDIAFNLLPPAFTLTQLQQVYEIILDRPLLKAAFRRKVAHLVQETDQYTENAGHRPSRLFRRREGEQ